MPYCRGHDGKTYSRYDIKADTMCIPPGKTINCSLVQYKNSWHCNEGLNAEPFNPLPIMLLVGGTFLLALIIGAVLTRNRGNSE